MKIQPFDESLSDSTIDALRSVIKTGDDYPPTHRVTDSDRVLQAWLNNCDLWSRWVATHKGEVIGHVLLCNPHKIIPHLNRAGYMGLSTNGFAEVAKLFVNPDFRSQGVGTELLNAVRREAWESGCQPVLFVVNPSFHAKPMYLREGFVEVIDFFNVHGLNTVMVDEVIPT
jgi:GNAT superfamily N-acetyltransferase